MYWYRTWRRRAVQFELNGYVPRVQSCCCIHSLIVIFLLETQFAKNRQEKKYNLRSFLLRGVPFGGWANDEDALICTFRNVSWHMTQYLIDPTDAYANGSPVVSSCMNIVDLSNESFWSLICIRVNFESFSILLCNNVRVVMVRERRSLTSFRFNSNNGLQSQ